MGILIYFQLNFEPSLSCTLLTSIAGLGLLGGLWPRLKNHKIFTEKLGIFGMGLLSASSLVLTPQRLEQSFRDSFS